jgi:hypothetical protein
MEKEYHKGQELTMAKLGLSLEELNGQPLELFAREGARLVLTVAMEEEVTAFLERRRYQRAMAITTATATATVNGRQVAAPVRLR